MPGQYQEHPVPPRLARYVECFWTLESTGEVRDYPVLPDGCADIVYSRSRFTEPQVVGTMTRAQTFSMQSGQFDCGVRFHPGMSRAFLEIPGKELADQSIPLSDLWSKTNLGERLANAANPGQCVALLEAQLIDPAEPGIAQQIAAHIVSREGQVRVDDLAFEAGMSARQLRRVFLEELGLSPKHFCRVIRFRHSVSQLNGTRRGDWTQLALNCGYYDQAHFINEFRELSGFTPGEFIALPR